MVHVIGPKDPRVKGAINTTSRSSNWSRGLSPFFVGPVILPWAKNLIAQNVENAWQFAKVYSEHLDVQGNPSSAYFKWAREGFSSPVAQRYPMGKGRKPEYSWWHGQKLNYIAARKKIYIPIYSEAVAKTEAYHHLQALYKKTGEIWLWDFDGYQHRNLGMTWTDVINNQHKSMGHAFVLAMMLEGCLPEHPN